LNERWHFSRVFGKKIKKTYNFWEALVFGRVERVKIGLKIKSKILSDGIFFVIEILFLRDPTDLKKANADPSLREVSLVI